MEKTEIVKELKEIRSSVGCFSDSTVISFINDLIIKINK